MSRCGRASLVVLSAALFGSLQAEPAASTDFANDVVPVLTRAGCNAANCHGAALGQAGFKLSLFGTDPEADYVAITHELAGRRIDRAEPSESLFLRKPTRRLPHRGGRVLDEAGGGYRALLAWAEGGFAPRSNDLRVERIEAAGGAEVSLRAFYSDGSARDVTHLALFSSNDEAIARVDERGRISRAGPGETAIMVRFAGHVAAVRAGEPYQTARKVVASALPSRNFVDERLNRALERLGLDPSPQCDDATFLRRAHLDIVGTLPAPEEVRDFLATPDRDALIEKLIARPEFDLYWGYRLGQLLGVSAKRMGKEPALAFHAWLKERARRPWTETAREILTASGASAPAAFYRLSDDPKTIAEEVGRAFLGARWQCAQCHNHPFERFRQRDYFGIAAMFARVRKTDDGIVHLDRGEITDPKTGKPALPVFPDGARGDVDGDRRVKLSKWVLSRDQFRRAFSNRIWALHMGRGLAHPVDDFRASNPPSHPELLDELSRLDTIPDLVRAIAGSAAYARAGPTEANRAGAGAFSHAIVRPLSAEVLIDAIAKATGTAGEFPDRPAGTRAIDLGDSSLPSYTLDVCGRNRPDFEGSLARELHFLAGDAVQAKLDGARPLLNLADRALVEKLYLRALSRLPSEREIERWTEELERGPRDEVAEDLLWALLNSWEFMTCQ